MAKVKLRQFDTLPTGPADALERCGEGVSTHPIFFSPSDPLHARLHRMAAGTSLTWMTSDHGIVVFVWSGKIRVLDCELGPESAIIIEHAAKPVQTVATEPAELLVFTSNPGLIMEPAKPGGHIHLLPAGHAPHAAVVNEALNVGGTLFADSDCDSCDLWLHGNDFHNPNADIPLHRHSEDEIIVVTGGSIVLGGHAHGPGTAVAIARDTIYGFGTGPTGLSFINFRACRPTFGFPDQKEMSDERGYYSALPSPVYVNLS